MVARIADIRQRPKRLRLFQRRKHPIPLWPGDHRAVGAGEASGVQVLRVLFYVDQHDLLGDPVEDVFALRSAVVAEAFPAAELRRNTTQAGDAFGAENLPDRHV